MRFLLTLMLVSCVLGGCGTTGSLTGNVGWGPPAPST